MLELTFIRRVVCSLDHWKFFICRLWVVLRHLFVFCWSFFRCPHKICFYESFRAIFPTAHAWRHKTWRRLAVSHGCKDDGVEDSGDDRRGNEGGLKMCKTNSSTTTQHFELDLDEAGQKTITRTAIPKAQSQDQPTIKANPKQRPYWNIVCAVCVQWILPVRVTKHI